MPQTSWVGQAKGDIKDIDYDEDESDEEDYEQRANKSTSRVFSMFKGLVGQKALTRDDIDPVLEKLREHLITKNVAAEVASSLCDSVAVQMEGQVLGTFQRVATVIRDTLSDALVQVRARKESFEGYLAG